ncbi:MAG: hypothetical protein L0J70_12555, partial [Corynebacterium sp.]|nr:hypothetical protein [Corynebacterium sp.]
VGAVSVILLNLLLNREGGGHLAEDTLEEELQDDLQDAQDAPAGPSGLRAVPAPASSSEV